MSGVKLLDKLLDGVGVEWKALESCATIERGRRVTKSALSPEKKYPVFSGGVTPMGFYDAFNQKKNTITIVKYGTAGFVNFIEADFWANDVCYCIKPGAALNNRYLFYYLKRHQYDIQLLATDAIPAHLPTEAVSTYKIPIPCPENTERSLKIQAEIVRILDTCTEITAELTAELALELAARKKQYDYYRDQLLSFEGERVDWKSLPEMSLDFGRGKSRHRPRNDERLYGGEIPFIQTGDIRGAAHVITQYSQTYNEFGLMQSKLWPTGTLCITIAANIAETSILGFDACFPDSVIGFVADPNKTTSGYVEYLLQSTKTKLEKKGKEKSSAQSNINLETFEQLKLPFPSLAKQARIVAILDKFDALTISISEGLRREIELRQKQYEHYRDLLLSFPKPEEVVA